MWYRKFCTENLSDFSKRDNGSAGGFLVHSELQLAPPIHRSPEGGLPPEENKFEKMKIVRKKADLKGGSARLARFNQRFK